MYQVCAPHCLKILQEVTEASFFVECKKSMQTNENNKNYSRDHKDIFNSLQP
jgi:hypothetical protein